MKIKTSPVHVARWGTYITAKEVSKSPATIELKVTIDNDSKTEKAAELVTEIFELDPKGEKAVKPVAKFQVLQTTVAANESAKVESSVRVKGSKSKIERTVR